MSAWSTPDDVRAAIETSLARPNLAVITNVGTSHMEILGSREAICEAKLEILSGMEPGSTVILDGDEPLFRTERSKEQLAPFRVLYVGFDPRCDLYPLDIYKGPSSISFDAIASERELRVTVPAIGDHFIKDSLYAVAVGIVCGVENEAIREGLLAYEPSGLRQRIYEKNGVTVIADCYNAAPESVQASLKVLGDLEAKRRIAVLGDMLELGSVTEDAHRRAGEEAVACGVDRLFAFGEASRCTVSGAVGAGMNKTDATHFTDPETLAAALKETLVPGDCILFKASRRMKLEDVIALCGLTEEEA